jgi:hypothetical protein
MGQYLRAGWPGPLRGKQRRRRHHVRRGTARSLQRPRLKRWSCHLAIERGGDLPERDDVLANVRNALEYLDEADFEVGHAVPGTLRSNRSLRLLPDGWLRVQVGAGLGGGLIVPEELEERALAVAQRLEDKLNAEVQHLMEQQVSLMGAG